MKKLIVVVNDLERSGKSALARAIAHHLADQEVDHLLVTSDEMDMTESFPGEFWDLEDQFELSQLIAAIDRHDAVVLDVHSGAARTWGEFFESEDLENLLAELDTEMTLVIPNTQSERCNEETTDIAELFADQCDYAIAHFPGADRTAIQWKGSDAEKSIRHLGACEIAVPSISGDLTTAVENTEVSLTDALNRPADLPRFAEVPVTQWLEKVSHELLEAHEYLLPEPIGSVALDY